jgi:hypothetical protein
MKRCPACEQTKHVTEFAKNLQRADGLQPYCRACRKEIDKVAYQKNRVVQVARNRATKTRNKKKMLEYLLEHPCVDCGLDNPLVLTFDHVTGEKRGDVARLINSSHSWKTILAEIEKCVVRCFNCHMIKTAKEKDWNRVKYLEELKSKTKQHTS